MFECRKEHLAIQTERSLNDLIGVQCYSSNTDINQEEIMQSWYTRTVNNCNLVELPHSVLDLVVTGENRVFNLCKTTIFWKEDEKNSQM